MPNARIMSYRHNSRWKSNALVKDLEAHGRQFLSALETIRADEVGLSYTDTLWRNKLHNTNNILG